jgi:hypothetical protein
VKVEVRDVLNIPLDSKRKFEPRRYSWDRQQPIGSFSTTGLGSEQRVVRRGSE